MITKELNVAVDVGSWGKRTPPSWASAYRQRDTVDLGRALLLLGSVTTPNALSAGSPERYWACVRYFSACAASSDLRIQMAFMDLDPHQKGILSDDFGVAISMAWLIDKMGGIRDVVDGRQFMINMGVRPSRAGGALPKVGPQKCPDFVLEDKSGKYHVLECKGTQSGRGYLNRAMAIGQVQKRGIKVAKRLRGESLVIGISLAGEGERRDSELVVIDPEEEPLTFIRDSDERKATEILTRLSLARALNLSGFSKLAFEISWPEGLNKYSAEMQLLTKTEVKFLSMKPKDRLIGWQTEIGNELVDLPGRQVGDFITQTMSFEIPSLKLDTGDTVRRITVRRGMNASLVEELSVAGSELHTAAIEIAGEVSRRQENIKITEVGHSVRLDQQGLFFSEVVFD